MLAEYWEQIKIATWNTVWAANLATLSAAHAGVLRTLRIAHMVVRELGEGQLTVRAASLVYTTLLSLVPVLAVTFAMLKTFGVHQDFKPRLMDVLEPFGDRAEEVGAQLIEFVENLQVGGLGAMGLAVLLITIVSLVHKIEMAFNYAWRVTRPRGMLERFSRYLTVVMVGPVLVFTALTIIGSITGEAIYQEVVAMPLVATAVDLGGKLVPYLLVVTAFAFTYIYIPNARVRVRSALTGAIFAGLAWVVAGWLFAELVVTSSRYTAIYRSFALLILFMMWLYIAWLILLAGASVAFYHQHSEYLGLLRHELRASNRLRERMAVAACAHVARAFIAGDEPPSATELARRLAVPMALLEPLLHALEEAKILRSTGAEPAGYVPARDLDAVTVRELLDAARRTDEPAHVTDTWLPPESLVDETMAAVEEGIGKAVGDATLRDLGQPPPDDGADGRARVTAITRDGAAGS